MTSTLVEVLPSVRMSAPLPPLWRHRSFVLWTTSAVVDSLGTAASAVALPLLVFQHTGSALQTGLVAALRVVPYLVFGLVAGPVADRTNRRAMLVWASIGQGVAMGAIPLVTTLGSSGIWHVYVATLASSVCFVFGDAASFGALPAMIGDDRLAAGNGIMAATTSAAMIAGPSIAGLLLGFVNVSTIVYLDAASNFAAAALVAGVDRRYSARPLQAAGASDGIRRRASISLAYVRRHRALTWLLLVGFANSFAAGIVLGQLVVFAVRALDVPESDARVGVLFAMGAVGALLAGLAFSRLFAPARLRAVVAGALGVGGLGTIALAVSPSIGLAIPLYLLVAICGQTVILTGVTFRQMATPDSLRASVNVIGRMVAWGGQPVGALIGGVVTTIADVRAALIVGATALLAGAATAGSRLTTTNTSLQEIRSTWEQAAAPTRAPAR